MAGLTADDVLSPAGQGESETVEFKLESEPQPQLGELLAAMANAHGGTLLIGVADDGRLIGVSSPRMIESRLRSVARYCSPPLEQLTMYPIEVGGKVVMVVQLPALHDAVYSYRGSFRKRVGAENIVMSSVAVVELAMRRHGHDFDRRAVLGISIDDLDPATVAELVRVRTGLGQLSYDEAVAEGLRPQPSPISLLLDLGAVTEVDGKLAPTIAGLLTLGRNPQAVRPEAKVQCARFCGTARSVFLDRAEIGGNIPSQLKEVTNFISRNTRHPARIDGLEREDLTEYPMLVVREAIVNALMHRDYSRDAPININIYDDRIEVVSPGGLIPPLTVTDLGIGHELRNHTIGGLLVWLRVAETWGTGVQRMRQAMIEAGLSAPLFESSDSLFSVTLYNEAAVARSGEVVTVKDDPTAKRVWPGLNQRQQDAITSLTSRRRNNITTGDYARRHNITDRQALRDLNNLVERGLLLRSGNARRSSYALPEEPRTGD